MSARDKDERLDRTERFELRLTKAELQAIREGASADDRSVASFIRVAVSSYLARCGIEVKS